MARTATWPPWAVTSLERQLDQLTDAVRSSGARTDDEQIWLTRFLVIRACGYLEQVVHETAVGHLLARTGGTGQSFALSWLAQSRNPTPESLVDLVGRFDSGLQTELLDLLDADAGAMRRELGLLLARRHRIAHGLNDGLGTQKALALVQLAKDLADWFIREMNPDAGVRLRPKAK